MRFIHTCFFLSAINFFITAALPTDSCKKFNSEIQEYFQTTGALSIIYQGIEQEKYPVNYLNNPYFADPDYTQGQVWFNGILYPNVNMRFDMYRQQLIVQAENQPYNILIPYEKLDSAIIHGFKLKYYPEIIRKNNSSGVCRLILFDEKVKLYIQPEAYLVKQSQNQNVKYKFVQKNSFFIEKSETLYPVKNLRSLQHIFPGQKTQIAEISKTHKLNYKKDPVGSLLLVLKNLSFE